jgi:DNA polymerase IV (archaeal DinB-like DNA polymerase)
LASSLPRAVIALDLDYFYAQCEEVRRPEIKDKPVVVCVFSGRTEDSGAVSTANYIARSLGVKSGIPIAFAKRILKDNQDAVFLPLDMEYYETVSDRVMDLVRSTGDVFEQASIDEAYIDVTRKSGLDFQKAADIARSLKTEILHSEKLTSSVGVASNKLMAKMAVDAKKPDGFTTILPGKEREFLAPLPVGKLFGIGPKTEQKLEPLGIVKVGDLAQADLKILTNLFGRKLGPTLREMANGIDTSPVVERPIEQLSRIVTLKQDAQVFDFQEVIRALADDLSEKLVASHFTCSNVGIIAITSELKIRSRSKSIGSQTQSADEIFQIAGALFSSYFHELQEGGLEKEHRLRRVGVKVTGLEKAEKRGTLEDFV